jgi:Flp pilus assembly secretin CpaC
VGLVFVLNPWFTNIVHLPLNMSLFWRAAMAKHILHIGIAAVFASSAAALPALAGPGIEVTMNQAKIVKLARNADTIIIGNPDIADASVQDASTVVLTGKGFGVTNIVILDGEGTPIIDEQITVTRATASSVRIYRRAEVQTLSCTPYCESSYKTDAERMSEAEMSSGQ